MAGVGLKLREMSSSDTLWSFITSHLYAVILSSTAWVISMVILLVIYFYAASLYGATTISVRFLVAVAYLISSSLTLSAVFQNAVNRFISDQVYKKKIERILPNFMAALLYLIVPATILGYFASSLLLADQPLMIKFLMAGSFVLLNIIWVFTNILAGLKNYYFILFSFLSCYLLIFILFIYLYPYELIGLLASFYIGHALMLILLFLFLISNYPSRHLFRWEIRKFMKANRALIFGGLFFYLGIWIDKYCFWIYPGTSKQTLGLLNASPIYDMPVFLSFILMIPALSMFFYEMETNFSTLYHRYYESILQGGTLNEINNKYASLQRVTRTTLLNTMKVQTIVAVTALFLAPQILKLFHLAPAYVFIFRIDIIGTSLLVLFIGQINLMYYLGYSVDVFHLTLFFFISNLLFSLFSIYLGPVYYGYGFALSVFICNLIAFVQLIHIFNGLTRNAFMQW
ncbi:hypothetical protein E3983_05185 [Legionella israelensis]|uniref:Transmembrane protein n=1 Tax=Legionella israelensis TaxID=454 RepID=A0AAX1EFI1_9GAMM|nr:exopolysaccharide Pel transporter PelG [Legionella israelensis]QBR83797.1 hypothetical protein E3983_05185 [Legionella israelensis]